MKFIPQTSDIAHEVPYFDEVQSDAGWKGHGTSKSILALKSEITQSVARLGGQVTGFVRGSYEMADGVSRDGFQIHYAIEGAQGDLLSGRIDVAALPVRETKRKNRNTMERRREKSLKMALYMMRDALDGQWFLQMLSPGYAALMPWMLTGAPGALQTVTEIWSESATMKKLLPPKGSIFEGSDDGAIDGDFREK